MKKSELKSIIKECILENKKFLNEKKLTATGHELNDHVSDMIKGASDIERIMDYIDEIIETDVEEENLEKQYRAATNKLRSSINNVMSALNLFDKKIK